MSAHVLRRQAGFASLASPREPSKPAPDPGGLRRIAAVIQHGNDRSFAVARRLGMRPERDIRTANGFKAQLWVVAPDQ